MCLVYKCGVFSVGFECLPFKKAQAKDIVLGVNGEIYNYTDLQDSLEVGQMARQHGRLFLTALEVRTRWLRIDAEFGHVY